MGRSGLYCANTIGAFGVVSAGKEWGRLASAVQSWALKLVGEKEVFILLFSDGAFLGGGEVFEEAFLIIIPLMILGYPSSGGKFWVKNELVWIGIPLDVDAGICGIFDVNRRFPLGELQLLF